MTTQQSTQAEAAERREMRRFLARMGRAATMGCTRGATDALRRQVRKAGGDPDELARLGRERVLAAS